MGWILLFIILGVYRVLLRRVGNCKVKIYIPFVEVRAYSYFYHLFIYLWKGKFKFYIAKYRSTYYNHKRKLKIMLYFLYQVVDKFDIVIFLYFCLLFIIAVYIYICSQRWSIFSMSVGNPNGKKNLKVKKGPFNISLC